MPNIFHITTRPAWDAAQAAGAYEAPSLASEGFIHMSAAHQVAKTANRRFRAPPTSCCCKSTRTGCTRR